MGEDEGEREREGVLSGIVTESSGLGSPTEPLAICAMTSSVARKSSIACAVRPRWGVPLVAAVNGS